MLLQHSQKPFWLYKFSGSHVSVWCQKKYLHCTLSWRPRTAFSKYFESKCQFISIYFFIKMFVPETSQDFICRGLSWGGDWIISFRQLTFCASQNVLQYFILIKIFENSTIFQHFDTSIYSIKLLNFFRQFGLQG